MSKPWDGHTPGPWVYERGGNWITNLGVRVCQFWGAEEDDFDNCEANAVLIAAAPDLARRVEELEKALREAVVIMAKATSNFGFMQKMTSNPDAIALLKGMGNEIMQATVHTESALKEERKL